MNSNVYLPSASSSASSSSFFVAFTPFSVFSTANSTNSEGKNATNEQLQWTQQSNQTGRLIVETLDGLELNEIIGDEHASAVHRLIVAAVVIALISALLIATVVLFRCYMLYCQDYLNIRRYQRPPHSDFNNLHMQNAMAEMAILWEPKSNVVRQQQMNNNSEKKHPTANKVQNATTFRMTFADSML